MGDRVSVSFGDFFCESPVLFSHWGGKEFARRALDYANKIHNWGMIKNNKSMPLGRYEPGTVMVNFIASIARDEGGVEITGNFYLEKEESDGDNSDNGHYKFQINEHGVKIFHNGDEIKNI